MDEGCAAGKYADTPRPPATGNTRIANESHKTDTNQELTPTHDSLPTVDRPPSIAPAPRVPASDMPANTRASAPTPTGNNVRAATRNTTALIAVPEQQEETRQQTDDNDNGYTRFIVKPAQWQLIDDNVESEEDEVSGEVLPDFDYIQWLQKKFDAVLSLQQPVIPPAATAATPIAAESASAATGKQVSDLDKALAVVRVRVQETEAQVKALQEQLEQRNGASRAMRVDHLRQKLHDLMSTSSTISSPFFTSSASYPAPSPVTTAVAEMEAEMKALMNQATHDNLIAPTNENVPARKPSAVPARIQPSPDETWGNRPQASRNEPSRRALAADAIFGVRLLAAINKAGHARSNRGGGGGSGANYLLGNELAALTDLTELMLFNHFHPVPTHGTAAYHERAAAPDNSYHQHNTDLHHLPAHPSSNTAPYYRHDSQHDSHYSTKTHFAPLETRERATQRIARTAKSTLRAAGGVVAKLWSAAGKALSNPSAPSSSNEARWFEEAHTYSHTQGTMRERHVADPKSSEGERVPDSLQSPGQRWRKIVSRLRAAAGGSQEAPKMSAEEEAFAKLFEQKCRERGGAECSRDSSTAYAVLQESRRSHGIPVLHFCFSGIT